MQLGYVLGQGAHAADTPMTLGERMVSRTGGRAANTLRAGILDAGWRDTVLVFGGARGHGDDATFPGDITRDHMYLSLSRPPQGDALMRTPTVLTATTLVITASFIALPRAAGQDPMQGMAGMNQRGAMAMGFDQEKTTHHFYLYEDGGAIDVSVNDAADTTNRDAIRSHLPHIAMLFGQGNFDAPMMVHDSKHVPGTAELTRLKDKVKYTYVELPKGGRVDIVTTDPAALKAVHEFMKFQITDHKTGDSLIVRKR